jgi:hypothetical protein
VTALDPKALAMTYEEDGLASGDPDVRPGVQMDVDAGMIEQYIIDIHELPQESAQPFSEWAESMWFEYNEDGDLTNKQVIDGMLNYWRGNA